MNPDYKKGIERKRIVTFPDGKKLISKELKSSREDLEEAQNRLSKEKYKYATITAYYSMFHAARALLYQKGYREKSHHYLTVAIDALYVETGAMEPRLCRALINAMILREEADYQSDFSKEGAEAAVQSAKEFLETAKKILQNKEPTP